MKTNSTQQNFWSDYNKTSKVEDMVSARFKDLGWEVKQAPKRKFKEWDLQIKGEQGTFNIEIKCDYMSAKTGNANFEFEGYGKPSGLLSGRPDDYFLVFYYDEQEAIIGYVMELRGDLYNYVKANHFRIVQSHEGNSLNYLIKKEQLFKQFPIKTLNF